MEVELLGEEEERASGEIRVGAELKDGSDICLHVSLLPHVGAPLDNVPECIGPTLGKVLNVIFLDGKVPEVMLSD